MKEKNWYLLVAFLCIGLGTLALFSQTKSNEYIDPPLYDSETDLSNHVEPRVI